jgi:DNA-binding MarR family transcriptional regulator
MPTKPRMKSAKLVQQAAEAPLDQSKLLKLLGYNCLQAYLCVVPMFVKRMAKYRLRPVEFTVLSLVKANPDINQKRLSQAIKVAPPNLATLLDRMEARGLLVRQRNPLDKRSQTLVLTPEGTNICVKAEKTASEAEVVTSLTDAERAELLRLLQKIFLAD